MDPLRHPDLVEVGHRLRDAFDRAAAAELEALRIARARARGLRDILIEWEDERRRVRVRLGSAPLNPMVIHGVGVDHLLLSDGERLVAVPYEGISCIEACP